jgi:hypothetical protein
MALRRLATPLAETKFGMASPQIFVFQVIGKAFFTENFV